MTLSIYSGAFIMPLLGFLLIIAIIIGCFLEWVWCDYNDCGIGILFSIMVIWPVMIALIGILLYVHWFIFSVVVFI
jgi:hypothetical protein